MHSALQPVWSEIEPYFILRQLKVYEKFIDTRQFDVYDKYYYTLKGQLSSQIPLADRIAFHLPPRISYLFVHSYKKWLEWKSQR